MHLTVPLSNSISMYCSSKYDVSCVIVNGNNMHNAGITLATQNNGENSQE